MRMLEEASDGAERVSYEAWLDAKFPRGRSTASRLCGNTDLLKQHIRPFEKAGKHSCVVCGKPYFWKCSLCPSHPRMCLGDSREKSKCLVPLTGTATVTLGCASQTAAISLASYPDPTRYHQKQRSKKCCSY